MTVGFQLADFTHRQTIAQLCLPFREFDFFFLAVKELDFGGFELLAGPIRSGMFVIGQRANAPVLELLEGVWTVAFTVKHHDEFVQSGVRGQLFGRRLVGHFLFQPGNNFLLEHLDQSRIHRLMNYEKGLSIHRIDPVVHCRSLIQFLPRHVVTR